MSFLSLASSTPRRSWSKGSAGTSSPRYLSRSLFSVAPTLVPSPTRPRHKSVCREVRCPRGWVCGGGGGRGYVAGTHCNFALSRFKMFAAARSQTRQLMLLYARAILHLPVFPAPRASAHSLVSGNKLRVIRAAGGSKFTSVGKSRGLA
jgi:hypothetical protein